MEVNHTMYIYIIPSVIVGLLIGAVAASILLKQMFEKEKKESKQTYDDIIERANNEAKTVIKEAKIEAKDIVFKQQQKIEGELKAKRKDIANQEKRMQQKMSSVEQKVEQNLKREEQLIRREKELNNKEKGLDSVKEEFIKAKENVIVQLEKIAVITKEEAKKQLMDQIVEQAKIDSVRLVKEIEEEAKNDAERKAQDILASSVQRIAGEFSASISASSVTIPNEEMKGRIIGREGRNIRSFEAITGVDIIIDDTPETITLSSFDPYRRETARLTLEKLMHDGRIHPTKIEELFEKSKVELDKEMQQTGEEALYKLGLNDINKTLVKFIGRLKYRTSYGQNVLNHSVEVAKIAGYMAEELGIDPNMAKRCGILHDIGKAIDYELEGSHTQIGVDLMNKYKEHWKVKNAILAHHNEEEHKCIEAVLVHAADIISASRPGARREVTETYVKRMEKLEEICYEFSGVSKVYAMQAGRDIRIIVEPDKINDEQIALLSKDISKRIEESLSYPGQIKVTVIREARAVEYAK